MSAIHWLNDIENSKQAFGEEAVDVVPVDEEVKRFFKLRGIDDLKEDDTDGL